MKNVLLVFLLIGMIYSCSKDDDNEKKNQEFVAGDVFVGMESGTDIADLFTFINQFHLEVDHISSLTFTSTLPSDNLQDVLDQLNQKTYTNDGTTWFVNGYLHYETNEITIFPRLFDMEQRSYQQDWLTSMADWQLSHKHHIDVNSGVIHFKVPVGQELLWKNRFESYGNVDWAELNYIIEIFPGNM